MRARKILWLVVAASLVLVAGCSQRLVDFTIISSKNIDLSKADQFKRGTTRVEGVDNVPIIIFPLGTPNVKEAIDRAIEKVPGAVALVDGVVTYKFFYFLFGQASYFVEGLPLLDPTLVSATGGPESPYMVCYDDPQTHEATLKYLTEADYHAVRQALSDGDTEMIARLVVNN